MKNIWLMPGVLMIYGASLDAQPHEHNAVQIIWPNDGAGLNVAGNEIQGAAIIDANVTHQLRMEQGWIVLVEPQSQLGEALIARLNGQPADVIHGLPQYCHQVVQSKTPPLEALLPLFNRIFSHIDSIDSLSCYVQFSTQDNLDHRIERLINHLNRCFKQTCLKPEKWRAADVAADLALSEGRFLHLFKAQMGVAWRPFLLWRRMLCAVNILISGESATHAAYVAGFSDSAHLSRSFRNMFGVSIRQASQVLANKN